jgi:hypothetical protein
MSQQHHYQHKTWSAVKWGGGGAKQHRAGSTAQRGDNGRAHWARPTSGRVGGHGKVESTTPALRTLQVHECGNLRAVAVDTEGMNGRRRGGCEGYQNTFNLVATHYAPGGNFGDHDHHRATGTTPIPPTTTDKQTGEERRTRERR